MWTSMMRVNSLACSVRALVYFVTKKLVKFTKKARHAFRASVGKNPATKDEKVSLRLTVESCL